MGLPNLDIEKFLIEFEILKKQIAKSLANDDLVPYIGATKDVNLGSQNLTTTGEGGFGGLMPYDSATFDLGSVGLRWRNLIMSGDITTLGNITANTANLTTADFGEMTITDKLITNQVGSGLISILSGSTLSLNSSGSSVVSSSPWDISASLIVDDVKIDGNAVTKTATGNFLVLRGQPTGTPAINIGAGNGISLNAPAGVISASPTTVGTKIRMTAEGGYCILLTNKTGISSIAGEVVIASTVTADAVASGAGGELQPIGVFLDSGVADGVGAWIVVSGIADIKADATGWAVGDRIVTSATAKRGAVNNLPIAAVHFQELGHAVEAAGANALGRCVLHQN